MKFIYLNIVFLFTLINLCSAQIDFNPNSNYTQFKEAEYHEKMLGRYGDSFYSLRLSTEGKGISYYIEKFNANDLSKKFHFPIGKFHHPNALGNYYTVGQRKKIEGYVFKDGKFFIFSKVCSEDFKEVKLLLDCFNLEDGKQIESDKVLCSVPATKEDFYKIKIQHSFSPDSSKAGYMMSFNDPADQVSKNKMCLFDLANNKIISWKEMPSTNEKKKIYIKRFIIDNQGEIYYTFFMNGAVCGLSRYNSLTNKIDIAGIGCSYTLDTLRFDEKGEYIYSYSIVYNAKKIENSLNLSISNLGIFAAKIDKKTLTLVAEKTNLFNSDIISKLICSTTEGTIDMSFRPHLYEIETGEYYFVCEQKAGYYAGEIIVSKLNSKFESIWTKVIPRNISARAEIGVENNSNSSIIKKGDNLNFIFYEHPKFELKNLDYNLINNCQTPSCRSFSNINIVSYKINSNGNIQKEVLFSNEKDLLILDEMNMTTLNGKFILRFVNGNKERFGTLLIK